MVTRKKAYLPAILLVTLRFTDVAPLITLHLVRRAVAQLYHWYLKLGVGLPTQVPRVPYTVFPTCRMRGVTVARAGAKTVTLIVLEAGWCHMSPSFEPRRVQVPTLRYRMMRSLTVQIDGVKLVTTNGALELPPPFP
jgi:hypothetical protein